MIFFKRKKEVELKKEVEEKKGKRNERETIHNETKHGKFFLKIG